MVLRIIFVKTDNFCHNLVHLNKYRSPEITNYSALCYCPSWCWKTVDGPDNFVKFLHIQRYRQRLVYEVLLFLGILISFLKYVMIFVISFILIL